MNFAQYLAEGRDAPLYHGTLDINQILSDNALLPRTLQDIDQLGNAKVPTQYIKKQKYGAMTIVLARGVSLSRNIKTAKHFASAFGVILQLDQRLLSQRHKIIPYNYAQNSLHAKTRYREIAYSAGKPTGSEYEEFVIGTINNLDKYLVKIWTLNKSHPLNKTHPKAEYYG